MKIVYILFAVFMIAGCGQVSIEDYKGSEPALNLRTFFDGELKAYGILQDRSGAVTRKFRADIQAKWDGKIGTLDEVFYFADGETTTRLWTLVDQGNGKFTGTAGDVVGEASGQVEGSAFNWVYTLTIPYKDGTIDVKLDDWLYLVTPDRLMNRTDLSKYGFKVGELTLIIEKH